MSDNPDTIDNGTLPEQATAQNEDATKQQNSNDDTASSSEGNKFFTQEDVDRIVNKRINKFQSKVDELENKISGFDTSALDKPQDRVSDDNDRTDDSSSQQQYQQNLIKQLETKVLASEESARNTYEDYDQVLNDNSDLIVPTVARAIASVVGDSLADFTYNAIKNNRDELARIATLTPQGQMIAIERLHSKLSTAGNKKIVSGAPQPIHVDGGDPDVRSNGSGGNLNDHPLAELKF